MAKISKEEWEQRVNNAGASRYKFVRWDVDGEIGWRSKVTVECNSCLNAWSASPNNLVRGTKCPACAGNKKASKEDQEKRINNAGLGRYEFVRWCNDDKFGVNDRCVVRCVIDGHVWDAYVNNLANKKRGCIKCRGRNSSSNLRTDGDIVSKEIKKISNGKFSFIRFVGEYVNCYSRAECMCNCCMYSWVSSVTHLKSSRSGCPRCAKYGYQLDKKGYLYALRSECGNHIKIGITNKPNRRHKELEIATPFKFNLVEQISGDGAKIAELEKYFHSKYERAGFTGFDGCTEWLICTPELLEELRNLGD